MPLRRPFTPGGAVVSGDGAGAPGAAMPTNAGMQGARPPMPMGGRPQGAPVSAQGPPPLPPAAMPGGTSPGGPTSPLNIGQMLQSQMQGGGPNAGLPAPGAPAMPPWGDEGNRGMPPKRVPISMGMGGPEDDASAMGIGAQAGAPADVANGNLPATMLKLLRGMGRV
jgi:hypothetical protein